jgi:hypothetical protein
MNAKDNALRMAIECFDDMLKRQGTLTHKQHMAHEACKSALSDAVTLPDGWVADAKRYQWLKDNNATVIMVETEKRGYRSTMPNAPKERWFEFEGWTVSTLPILHESYKTMDEAIDAAMLQVAPTCEKEKG